MKLHLTWNDLNGLLDLLGQMEIKSGVEGIMVKVREMMFGELADKRVEVHSRGHSFSTKRLSKENKK